MARAMKDSGIEWIGEMPLDWSISKLKYEFSDYKAGPFGSALITEKLNDEGAILVYTPEHVSLRTDETSKDQYLPEERRQEMSQFFVKEGDIIFPIVGSLGRAMKITAGMKDGIINQRLAKFKMNSRIVEEEFFLWLFSRSSFYETYIDLYRRGSIIVNLTKAIVGNMPIPIPAVIEQKSIVSFLDDKCAEIDELMADVQTQIETLEQYKRSVITDAVTKGLNPNVPMKDSHVPWIGKIPETWGVDNPKWHFIERKDRAYPGLVQLTASQKYGVITQEEYMQRTGARVVVVQKDFDILKLVCPGDFVIHMRSFQGGLEYSELKGSTSSAYIMLIPKSTILEPRYYRWFFKSDIYIDALSSTTNLVRDGQAMRWANFIQLPILFPSKEEQQAIASYLDTKCAEIDAIIDGKRQQLAVLEEYKKSVIFEYVTGKKEVPVA